MCYDVKAKLEAQLKRARHYQDEGWIRKLEEKLRPYYDEPIFHASGFAHPTMLIYTNDKPYEPILAVWGLIPHWVKDSAQKRKLWNNTLNARGETIFEKPSFRSSAKNKRCLIVLEGFYEHHHFKGKTYPFFVSRKDGKLITVAGLWSEWVDKETGEVVNSFTIVTTQGNDLLSKIHNNPKLKGPRMPVILPDGMEDEWLRPINTDSDKEAIIDLIQPYTVDDLLAHSVRRLRGKEAVGNVPEASEKFEYPELEIS